MKKYYCIISVCFSVFIMFSSCSGAPQREMVSQTSEARTESSAIYSDINEPVGATGADENKVVSESKEEIGPTNFIASHAISSSYNDGLHKFIRSAQLRFKVKAIPEATFLIEDIINKHKGFILQSSIYNEGSYSETINISQDSALVQYNTTLAGRMKLKVPQSELDTVLKRIAPLAIVIDYRTLEATDITLRIMSDSLKQIRENKKSKRIVDAINSTGAKLKDVIDAENTLDNTLEEVDNTVLSAFSLQDQVEYSIIDIQLYQSPTQYTEKVLIAKPVEEFKPSLASKATDALSVGWYVLSSFFILFLNIWPIVVIGVIVLVYNKRRKRNG